MIKPLFEYKLSQLTEAQDDRLFQLKISEKQYEDEGLSNKKTLRVNWFYLQGLFLMYGIRCTIALSEFINSCCRHNSDMHLYAHAMKVISDLEGELYIDIKMFLKYFHGLPNQEELNAAWKAQVVNGMGRLYMTDHLTEFLTDIAKGSELL